MKICVAMLDRHHPADGKAAAIAGAVDLIENRDGGVARRAGNRHGGSGKDGPAGAVRLAATSAWARTWPPKTRCDLSSGLKPRKMFSSTFSRSSRSNQIPEGSGHAAVLKHSRGQAIAEFRINI